MTDQALEEVDWDSHTILQVPVDQRRAMDKLLDKVFLDSTEN
jgi:hypothetical protein